MPLDFTATEIGFEDGVGGASNAAGAGDPHYVLFGRDGDGVYVEYDDQIHGGVDQVAGVSVRPAWSSPSSTEPPSPSGDGRATRSGRSSSAACARCFHLGW